MIKLFASDLDGTLLNAVHQVDHKILRCIREVTDSGCHVAVATGRTMRSTREIGFGPVEIEAVCANGSIILDRTGRVIRHRAIDPVFIEELLRAFPQVCFECVGLSGTYVTGTLAEREAGFSTDGLFMRIVMSGMRRRARVLAGGFRYGQGLAEICGEDICKVNARVLDPGLDRELQAFIVDHADMAVNAPFNPVMFEITAASVNKGEAVAWLTRHLGFSEDEVAVYGDGGNDIAMLERFGRFGHAYATRNGSDAAKRAAGQVIGCCASHAVPRHMARVARGR